MKRKNLIFGLVLLLCMITIKAMGQAKSLVIENQSPGWVSSKIGYLDQISVENLKITGYINAEDLKFIASLMKNYSLHGRLDLEDANIVNITTGENNSFPYDTDIWGASGVILKRLPLQYLSIPKSLTKGEANAMAKLDIDTLFINTTTGYGNPLNAKVKHLVIGDNVTVVNPSFGNVYEKKLETLGVSPNVTSFKANINSANTIFGLDVTIQDAKNLKNFPSCEKFFTNIKTVESPDSVYFPNIKELSLDLSFYYDTHFFKKGMHIFLGKKIELLTEMGEARGINIHFSNPIPPTIETSYTYHHVPYNLADYILYVPIGSGDAYRACFRDNGTLVTIIEEEAHDFIPTSVNSPYGNQVSKEVCRYDLNGTKLSSQQKGINIIRMSDGTTKKVIVK